MYAMPAGPKHAATDNAPKDAGQHGPVLWLHKSSLSPFPVWYCSIHIRCPKLSGEPPTQPGTQGRLGVQLTRWWVPPRCHPVDTKLCMQAAQDMQ